MTTRIYALPFMCMKAQSSLTNYMRSSSTMKHISKRITFLRHLLARPLPSNHPTTNIDHLLIILKTRLSKVVHPFIKTITLFFLPTHFLPTNLVFTLTNVNCATIKDTLPNVASLSNTCLRTPTHQPKPTSPSVYFVAPSTTTLLSFLILSLLTMSLLISKIYPPTTSFPTMMTFSLVTI